MQTLLRTFGLVCLTGLAVTLMFSAPLSSAHAACANPSADVGDIIYNAPGKAFQGCTRGGWKAFHAVEAPEPPDPCSTSPSVGMVCKDGSVYVGLTPDGDLPMFTTPGDSPTRLMWDTSSSPIDTPMENCGSGASCRTGLANTALLVALSTTYQAAKYCEDLAAHGRDDWYLPARDELTLIYDNKALIGGVTETSWHWSSSEFDANTAHYRFMSSGGAGQGGKPTNGWVRCVRQQASGGGGAQDDTPNAFSFAALTGQALNTQVTSNSVTIAGIGPAPVAVSVTGAGSPQININGAGWVSSGTISAGQTLQVRLTTANANATLRSATVTVGTLSSQWDVTTQSAGNTPDNFTFTNLTNQPLNTLVTSDIVTISGLGSGSVYTQASGSGNPEIRINGGAWVTSGFISNGQTLQVRMTSAATVASAYPVVVLVGTLNSTWTVTTVASDHTPDTFSFTDLTGQALSALVTSETVTITGLGPEETAVNVSGDGSPQISINGGAWVTSGTIMNNQTLQARMTTANAGNILSPVAVVVGSVEAIWNVTTAAASCVAIGDVCPNGMIYAGDHDGSKLYVTADNIAGSPQWGPTGNTSGMGFCLSPFTDPSCSAGRENTQLLKDSGTTYPAAEYCADLVAHGYDDWYLPSRIELNIIYQNLKSGKPAGTYNFQDMNYWTSSEQGPNIAWMQVFTDGSYWLHSKLNPTGGRCARNDAPDPPDHTPDVFTFTDLTVQMVDTQVLSDTITIAGLGSEPVEVTVSGEGSPQVSINGGAWVTSGTILNNQTLRARATTAGTYSTDRIITVTVGSLYDQWSIRTSVTPTCIYETSAVTEANHQTYGNGDYAYLSSGLSIFKSVTWNLNDGTNASSIDRSGYRYFFGTRRVVVEYTSGPLTNSGFYEVCRVQL